jgi:hypothetical protein
MASYTPDPTSTPPVPPPKPGSHDASGINTPTTAGYPPPVTTSEGRQLPSAVAPPPNQIPDPGDQWLPQILQDKSYVVTTRPRRSHPRQAQQSC